MLSIQTILSFVIQVRYSSIGVASNDSVVLLAVQDPQNGQEQVQNVQIERNRRRDLLLNVVMPDDQLGIHQDIPTEDQSSHNAIAELNAAAPGEEGGHESKEDQNPKRTK